LIGEASWWDGAQRFVAVKAPASAYPGAPQDRCHLAALVGLEDALDEVSEECRRLGFRSVVFGTDHDHIWPGYPQEDTAGLERLMKAGFRVTGRHVDLERDLTGYQAPEASRETLRSHGAEARPATNGDIEALDRFLSVAFPGRWRHDTMRKVVEDQEAEDIVLLWVDGKVAGFALTQREGVRRPIGGAVWRRSLGPRWGALGPIGLAPEARGQGLGGALLASALERLAQRGARRTIIDWTTLEGFYQRHGFETTRRYVALSKDLDR
jgi:ribosomal protein S18 acetylase RimI-like enzyme